MTRVPIPIKTPDHHIVGYLSFDQAESQHLPRQVNLFKILQTGLHQVGQWLSHNPQEPCIYKERNNQATHKPWKVFDPISQSSLAFETETDVRNWLERRYYQ